MPQELASKVSHTPGPWTHRQCAVEGPITPTGRQAVLAIMQWPQQVSREVAMANARLIAAAPEMLEALELYHAAISAWRTTGRMPDYAEWVRFFDKGEAAIRKARGGE